MRKTPEVAKNYLFHFREGLKFSYPSDWKTIFSELRQYFELVLIVNVYVTLYWFFIPTLHTVLKEATIKRSS